MYFPVSRLLLISFCIWSRISYSHCRFLQKEHYKFDLKISSPHKQSLYSLHNPNKKYVVKRKYPDTSLLRNRFQPPPEYIMKNSLFKTGVMLPEKMPSKYPLRYIVKKKKTECDGLENLTSDIGIISYVLSVISLIFGVADTFISVIDQFLTVTSTWASWASAIPSAIITLSGKSDQVTYIIANIFSFLSILATILSHIGIPVGYLDLIVGTAGEIIGFVSTAIGTFSTFPHLLEKLIDFLVEIKGQDVQNFVDSYGCPS